ncbi:MAG: ABC transporter ATP-binding protein [Phycisphaeraceae bacterium]|nr:MAG: ABC transporter ATP-binding protein [Phycisphaeraceae bacterium]
MGTRIRIDNVSKIYPPQPGSSEPFAAVDRASLQVEPGELFFLLGPSGCGKTTLLRMISGFIQPTSGRIYFNDADITDVPAQRRNTGMVFQSYALWPHMTVEANVRFGLDVRKTPAGEAARRVADALRSVQMTDLAARKPTQLSGGQQQRVALARAVVVNPDVLLLDEPLSNLDARLRIELRSEIRRLCKAFGITGLYVTHDQKEALSMADRIAIFNRGRLIQVDTPESLYMRPRSAFAASFIGEANILDATVLTVGDGDATVAVGDWRFQAVRPGPVTPNQRVRVAIRPESIRTQAPGSPQSDQAFAATITDRVFLGDHTLWTLAVGQIEIKAITLGPAQVWSASSGALSLTLGYPPPVILADD